MEKEITNEVFYHGVIDGSMVKIIKFNIDHEFPWFFVEIDVPKNNLLYGVIENTKLDSLNGLLVTEYFQESVYMSKKTTGEQLLCFTFLGTIPDILFKTNRIIGKLKKLKNKE